jgi:HPr kinase/phosphorylase
MAMGASLVADDQTNLVRDGDRVIANAPANLRGLIEARGVGILRADPMDSVAVALVTDLGEVSRDRLPQARQCDLLGLRFDLVQRADGDHFPASLLCYLLQGRHA